MKEEFKMWNNKYKLTNSFEILPQQDREERQGGGVEESIQGFFEGNFSIYNFF